MSEPNEMGDGNTYRPVRDRRDKPWYWKNNALYDFVEMPNGNVVNFAMILGPSAMAVYDILARMADEETQTCFPSVATLSYWTGIGDSTISDSITLLRWHRLIEPQHRESDEGDLSSNMYALLPISDWLLMGGHGNPLPPRIQTPLEKRWNDAHKRKRPESLRKALRLKKIPKFLPPGGLNSGVPRLENLPGGGLNSGAPYIEQAFKEQTSYKQSSNNNTEKIVVVPAAVVKFENSNSNAGELETRIAKVQTVLNPFKLAARVIRDFAVGNIDHAEYVAREFPHEPESEVGFWNSGKKGSPAAALRLRLENWGWRSTRDIEREEREQVAALDDSRREQQQAHAAQIKRDQMLEEQAREALAFETKVRIGGVMSRFEELPRKRQAQVLAEIAERADCELLKIKGGDLSSIKPDSLLWPHFVEAVGKVLAEWDASAPKLPEFDQRAAGEVWAEDEPETVIVEEPRKVRGNDDFSSAAGLVSPGLAAAVAQRTTHNAVAPSLNIPLLASAHFNKIVSHNYDFEDIDDYRNPDLDDDEWAQVLAEVERKLNELKRIAA